MTTYTLELHPDTHPAETQRPDYWRSQITGRVVSMLSDADKVAPHLGDRLRAVLLCATNLERLARGAAPLVNDETEETCVAYLNRRRSVTSSTFYTLSDDGNPVPVEWSAEVVRAVMLATAPADRPPIRAPESHHTPRDAPDSPDINGGGTLVLAGGTQDPDGPKKPRSPQGAANRPYFTD